MSRQGAGAKKEESSGLGFLGTLAVAGGAAALGYMASDLWKTFQEVPTQPPPLYGAQGRRAPAPPQRAAQPSELQRRQARQKSKQSNENIPEGLRCVVCLDNQREYVLDPCGHVALCMDCGDKLNRCPICQSDIRNKKLVYVS